MVTLEVRNGDRPLGAFVSNGAGTSYRPVVDVTTLGVAALATVAVTAVAVSTAVVLRRRPAIGSVSMGPGGWVSVKGLATPPLRVAAPRPWWARLLRARRLVVQG